MKRKTFVKKFMLCLTSFLLFLSILSCSRQSFHSAITLGQLDSRTVLSNAGINLRVFDIDGNPLFNPGEQYSLRVTTEDNVREVVVSTKTEVNLRGSNLELRFDGKNEYPSDWQCGEAMSKYQPLSFTGCPSAGMIICSQVIPGTKEYKVSGELLRFKLQKGVHQVRATSGFEQNPNSDPIFSDVTADKSDNNKFQFSLNLRGDGNGNLIYEFADFGVVGAKYNQKRSEKPDSEVADGNNNKLVDFADFGVIGANYNKGVGGIDIYRDDNDPPTSLLGRLSFDKQVKGDFTIDPKDISFNSRGFLSYKYTFGGKGKFVKLVLFDKNGQQYSNHNVVIEIPVEQPVEGWPMIGRDSKNTRRTNIIGPATNTLKWEYKAEGNFVSPVISADNKIIVSNIAGKVYSFDANGKVERTFPEINPLDSFFSSPMIDQSGNIYVGCKNSNFYGINKDGKEAWNFKSSNEIYGSPIISPKGNIYFGNKDGNLYALDKSGKKLWEFAGQGQINNAPAVDSSETVYVGTYDADGTLYSIDSNGKKLWEFKPGGTISTSIAIGPDGVLFFGSGNKILYAVNKDGSKKWEFSTGAPINSSPAIGTDGTVYFGSNDKKLYAVNSDGSKKWEFTTNGEIFGSPAVDGNGTVYFGSMDGKLYAINPDGTKKWEYTAGNSIITSPAIGPDGTLYFSSLDQKLYAIGVDNNIYPPEEVITSKGAFKNKIVIKWKNPKKGKVPAKFNIYRKKVGEEFKLVNSVLGTVNEYSDDLTPPDNNVYEYQLTSVDDNGIESAFSNIDQGWLTKSYLVDNRGDWWTINGNEFNTRESNDILSDNMSDKNIPKQEFTGFMDNHKDDKIVGGGVYNKNGVHYFGTEKGYILAYDPYTNSEKFYVDPMPGAEAKYNQPLNGAMSVLPNGNIVGSSSSYSKQEYNQVFMIDENGGPLSIIPVDGPVEGGVFPHFDNSIYIGTNNFWSETGSIYHIDGTGKVLEQTTVPTTITSSPAFVPNTYSILFSSYSPTSKYENLYEVDLNSGKVKTHNTKDMLPQSQGIFSTSPMVAYDQDNSQSTVYIMSDNGKVYAMDWPYTGSKSIDFNNYLKPIHVHRKEKNVWFYDPIKNRIFNAEGDKNNFSPMTKSNFSLDGMVNGTVKDIYYDINSSNRAYFLVFSYDDLTDKTYLTKIPVGDSVFYNIGEWKGEVNVTAPSSYKGSLLVQSKDGKLTLF